MILSGVVLKSYFCVRVCFSPYRMDNVAKRLSDEWRTRHLKSSEEAFAEAEKGIVKESGPSFFQKERALTDTVLAAMKR